MNNDRPVNNQRKTRFTIIIIAVKKEQLPIVTLYYIFGHDKNNFADYPKEKYFFILKISEKMQKILHENELNEN